MSARDDILSDIRKSLVESAHGSAHSAGASRADATPSPAASPNLPDLILAECAADRPQLIERFSSALLGVGGAVTSAASPDALTSAIDSIVTENRAKSVIAWNSPLIAELNLDARFAGRDIDFRLISEGADKTALIDQAAAATVGITSVDYALADSGSLALLSTPNQPRSTSLLPPIHIAILESTRLVRGLDDFFALLPRESGRPASAITLITGPSRTADIELTLVVGVHGPQQLHVILT